MPLHLRNPHSILAALETRPQDVSEVRITAGRPPGAWGDVVHLAEAQRIPVMLGAERSESRRRQKGGGPQTGGRSGAGEAILKPRQPVEIQKLFADAEERDDGRGVWLALDCLQDPHNVGAIFRSAAFFGVQGIVVTKDRSAPLNSTVYDVASGGLDDVPFALETNLGRTLEAAKTSGLWVLGTSEHAATDLTEIDRDRPWLLVVGNEEKGLRRKTLEKCDAVCRLTPRGRVTSLNVSVATGISIATLCQPSGKYSDN